MLRISVSSVAKILTFILLILFVFGCSGRGPKVSLAGKGGRQGPALEAPTEQARPPFALWNYGQDLEGQSISDSTFRRADEYFKRSDIAGALSIYRTIEERLLTKELYAALVIRKATAYLSLQQPDSALDLLSAYFEGQNVTAEEVTGHFALMLAYAYGASSEVDQALAWFSKTSVTESNSPIFSDAAEKGVRFLLNAIPTSSFLPVAAKWKSDPNIGVFVAQEDAIRNVPENKNKYNTPLKGAFWLKPLPGINPLTVPLNSNTIDSANLITSSKIGVILPLSGPLAPLGDGTKNGMQIAIDVENEPRIEVIFKDPGFQDPSADIASVEQVTRSLIKNDQVNLLVGPLLSEQAPTVRTVALQERVPQLSLSKGNSFETGDIIFRFGATSNSQMDTLLDAASDVLGMRKFALVYPELPFGLEYATSFKKYLTAKGLQLVYEATYSPGDSAKLSLVASEVERLSIDGIFVPDNIEGTRSFLSLLSEEFRNRVRPMGPATWDSPQELAQSQAIFQRALFISPFFIGSANPLIRRFIDRYKAKFGKAPDFLAAQGFDAMTLAIGAARKVMNEGGSFDLALKHIESYDGLTGRMQVDVSGEVRRAYTVLELREGRLQILARDSKGDLSDQAQTNQENNQETANQGRY